MHTYGHTHTDAHTHMYTNPAQLHVLNVFATGVILSAATIVAVTVNKAELPYVCVNEYKYTSVSVYTCASVCEGMWGELITFDTCTGTCVLL